MKRIASVIRIEVDQSGKVEQLDTTTVLVGSDGEIQTVVIPAGIKRKLIREARKTLISSRDVYVITFSILTFLLLGRFRKRLSLVEIDEEYTGHSVLIKETLVKLFRRHKKPIPEIRFRRIGKRSRAHLVAWAMHRSKRYGGAWKVHEKDVFQLWEQKSRP